MPWTLPPCTCPRDDSGNTQGCERHDSRSDWNQATEFYANPAEPLAQSEFGTGNTNCG